MDAAKAELQALQTLKRARGEQLLRYGAAGWTHQDVRAALSIPHVSGISLWQFMDIKADDGATKSCGSCVYAKPYNASTPMDCAIISAHCWRPGGENHKGLVDLWRRPKRVFASVQKLFMHDTH